MSISAVLVKELRGKTGAGVMECRNALTKACGDMEKAIEILRQKGIEVAEKKKERVTAEGRIDSYIHGGRIGALVEVKCETDFVAKTDEFKTLVRELAMQIAAQSPKWISRSHVPLEVVEKEKNSYFSMACEEGMSREEALNLAEVKIENFYRRFCLLEQPYIRDESKSVEDLVAEVIAKLRENIVVKRFARFALGE